MSEVLSDNTWRPTLKQERFLSLPYSVLEGFYAGAVGAGKAIDINELIPTIDGYKRMRDIHVGDSVYNHEGNPVTVIAETEIFLNHKCYKLNFDCGQSIICDAEHKWIVHPNLVRNKRNKYTILTSEELAKTTQKYSTVLSEPLFKTETSYPLDPYTLGVWLGDGNRSDPKFTSVDAEIVNQVELNHKVRKYNYGDSYRILDIVEPLRLLNLINNKHIPSLYFNLDFDLRLELLQGLMDTDGYIDTKGRIEISLSDEQLANGVLKLIRSLGIKGSCTINKSVLNGKNYKDRHRIKFTTELQVFRLSRKLERQQFNRNNANFNKTKWHYIDSVEEVESVPVKCIQVIGSIYLVSTACIPTHNSDVLLLYPIIHRFHENPEFKGLYLRRTFPELKNEIIPRSRKWFKALGGEYNKSDKVWSFPSGALFFFGHCEDEDDVHHYDSMQPNYVAFDELTSFTEWQYLYITLERVRTKRNSKLPAIVRSASNPGNIGHNWVRKRFIDLFPDGGKLIQSPSGIKRIYIPATIIDNPHIDPEYRKSLEALPEAEKQAKLYGNWSAYEGAVFEEFRDKHYPDEPDNALHCIEPFEIPEWWPRLISIDWGYAPPAMTAVLYGAISPNKRLYIYRTQTWQKTAIEMWASYVREYVDKENPRMIKLCKSAGQDRGQEHTIHSQVSEALGRNVDLTSNQPGSRIAGKILLHEYLRWKQRYNPVKEIGTFDQERASWILRNRTINEYHSYIDSFNPIEPESNIPKLIIFNTEDNKVLVNAIKSCAYDKTNPQDVAEFPGDDPYDALRYIVDGAERYFAEAESEFHKVQATENLINRLQNNGDFTAFYRNARSIELQGQIQPISRYRRAR